MPAVPASHVPYSHPPAQERGWHCWDTARLGQAAPSSLGSPSQQGTGQGTQGVSNPLLPSSKGGSSSHGGSHKPSVGIQCPRPAETPNSSHQWWRGGRTGRVQRPLRGTPSGDRLCTPLPNSARDRAGAGPDPEPRRVFPAPVPVQEAPERPRLRPRAQCWEQGGGTGTPGHGDLSQSSAFNCFSTPPWAGLNATGPRCPCVPTPGLNPDPQGKGGCSSHLLGVPSSPAAGGHGSPRPRGTAGPQARRTIVQHFPPSPRD